MEQLPKNKPCPHCGRYANRGVSIDALIVKNNKILLIKRGSEPFKGFWGIPGGYVDWEESAEEAVKREVSEELGLTVKTVQFIGIYTDPKRHPNQTIDIAYAATISGEPKIGDDAQAFQWADLDNLPELAFDHKKIIEDYLKLK
jgi:8-oxo-dGTP diphosphatase